MTDRKGSFIFGSVTKRRRGLRRFAAVIFLAAVAGVSLYRSPSQIVQADEISDLEQQKGETEQELNEAEGNVDSLQEEQDSVSAEMSYASDALVQNMASISLLQQQITTLEQQIADKQVEYDAAKEEEQRQYEAMCARIKFIYEKGDANYVSLLMNATSFGDMMNKATYTEKLYDYDRQMLADYQAIQATVAQTQQDLEDEKAELLESQDGLQEEQDAQNSRMAQLQETYDDYEVQIAQAQQEANALALQVQQQTAQISALAEEQARQAEAQRLAAEQAAAAAAAASTTSTASAAVTDNTSASAQTTTEQSTTSAAKTYTSPSGSTGSDVVNYACQFVGNPYVYGGTSLTNGTDCSGFTMSVYKAFGYSLPRTAEAQRSAGIAVDSLADAQPGDLICYPGHVALYCGNGTIVHASTAATGIKYSVATYRSILCIRRIIY